MGSKKKNIADKNRIESIIQTLTEMYPERSTKHRNPFQALITTVLSHRSRDANTEKAAERLFATYPGPKDILDGDPGQIQNLIKPAGLYRNKTEKIKKISKIILEKYNGKVPKDRNALLSLPGVGRKTANCVLVFGFGIPAMPVDAHVHRIANRIGFVRTKTPYETEFKLVDLIPNKYWLDFNKLLVTHGQNTCKPIGPKCKECCIKMECDHIE